MLSHLFAFLCRFPFLKRLLWQRWYQFLARRYQIPEWQIMNYGYAPIPAAPPLPIEPENESERYGLQLYHHVASAVPWIGLEVLEVGCGRGGGAAWLHRNLQPATLTAVDFSAEAIALCQKRYTAPDLTFLVGDAEKLPLPAAHYNVVINVESSHCYGSMEAFLREVHRVLKPGGHFLHADFRSDDQLESWHQQLRNSGLELIQEANITPNVLAALDADDARKRTLMAQLIPKHLLKSFGDFAAIKGSLVYEEFRRGGMQYFQFVLRKS